MKVNKIDDGPHTPPHCPILELKGGKYIKYMVVSCRRCGLDIANLVLTYVSHYPNTEGQVLKKNTAQPQVACIN